ncbi:sulfatase [Verrucomicrobiales bacterium]|nr:sulfatase [Verrucomicrobiales bacterium]
MLQRHFHFLLLVLSLGFLSLDAHSQDDKRPNILWIIPDDMSANFSCYGEKTITTPHVDQLAAEGTKFMKAFVTAPVCSTCRSAFITGMYQTSIGAHHHRSGQGEMKIKLPDDVAMVPALFQKAGYYTSLGGWPNRGERLGKSDYNFEWDQGIYDSNDWSNRKEGQPFFAQIQTPGGKLRGSDPEKTEKFAQSVKEKMGSRTKPEEVTLPPYYPRDPVLLHDWAAYLDSVRETDRVVGEIVQKLKDDDDYENTIIIFMTDHGISHARGKQFMYEEGLHVPLVISGPGITPGTARDDLVEHIDITALSLAQAGIAIPENMQARDILAKDYQPREAVFAARDRCDETVEHLRSVRTQQFKYIRNFLPERPHLQPCAYKDAKSILIALRAAHAAGTLDEVQEQALFSPQRAPEELYDLEEDPFEINNLATDPAHEKTLLGLRKRLDDWMVETNDLGRTPESMKMYDSDMAPYLEKLRIRQPNRLPILEANIKQMKAWAAEGK